MGPAAMESPEPQEPRTLHLVAVHQALSGVGRLDLVGFIIRDDQLDLVFLAPDGDGGIQTLASLIPSTSSAPPAALAPVSGSKTPNLIRWNPACGPEPRTYQGYGEVRQKDNRRPLHKSLLKKRFLRVGWSIVAPG
jgi:hypothetical protein